MPDPIPDSDVTADDSPWGHKVTVHIFVAGDLVRAVETSECVLGQILLPTAEFVGVSINEVPDQPKGMGDG